MGLPAFACAVAYPWQAMRAKIQESSITKLIEIGAFGY